MTEKRRLLTRGRVIRWAIYLAVLAIVLTRFQRFGCSRIGSDAALAMKPVLLQGKSYLVDEEPDEELMRDAIVFWYTVEGGQASPHYSRVRGIPGDVLKRTGETWAFEDGAGELFYLPRDLQEAPLMPLVGQRLGKGQYFLLNDNRSVDLPDSRTLGLIDRKRIRARILPSLFGGG